MQYKNDLPLILKYKLFEKFASTHPLLFKVISLYQSKESMAS